jgi:hypothetical protein
LGGVHPPGGVVRGGVGGCGGGSQVHGGGEPVDGGGGGGSQVHGGGESVDGGGEPVDGGGEPVDGGGVTGVSVPGTSDPEPSDQSLGLGVREPYPNAS